MLKTAVESKNIDISVWGLDPTLNIALQFALAERLIEHSSTGVKLTKNGKDYIAAIDKNDLFTKDIEYLKDIGKAVTEDFIKKASDSWG